MTQEDNQQMPELKWYQIKALEEYPMPKYIQTLEMRTDDIVIKKQDAYIKGLLNSPSGKCREALQRIIDLYPSSHEHGMANIALNDIRQTAIDALTLDSWKDQDEVNRLKELLREVCVRANIIFPEREGEIEMFDEGFNQKADLLLNLSATLGLGEVEPEDTLANETRLAIIKEQFKNK